MNSYHRLVPGFEAPVNLVYSARNRSAAVRIPVGESSPESVRLEFRVPDPGSNPYLAFSAQILAGLDGIKNRIEPGPPADYNLFALSKREIRRIPKVPASLEASVDALRREKDSAFLREGNCFTDDLIEAWIELKQSEIETFRLRPHPYEFDLYYGI